MRVKTASWLFFHHIGNSFVALGHKRKKLAEAVYTNCGRRHADFSPYRKLPGVSRVNKVFQSSEEVYFS